MLYCVTQRVVVRLSVVQLATYCAVMTRPRPRDWAALTVDGSGGAGGGQSDAGTRARGASAESVGRRARSLGALADLITYRYLHSFNITVVAQQ